LVGLCRVQGNSSDSRLTFRVILRSPELVCESLPLRVVGPRQQCCCVTALRAEIVGAADPLAPGFEIGCVTADGAERRMPLGEAWAGASQVPAWRLLPGHRCPGRLAHADRHERRPRERG
jgi:hypothetical protein